MTEHQHCSFSSLQKGLHFDHLSGLCRLISPPVLPGHSIDGSVFVAQFEGVQLKVGIHVGPVAMTNCMDKNFELLGKDVSRTMLLNSAAEPGQILISKTVWSAKGMQQGFKVFQLLFRARVAGDRWILFRLAFKHSHEQPIGFQPP